MSQTAAAKRRQPNGGSQTAAAKRVQPNGWPMRVPTRRLRQRQLDPPFTLHLIDGSGIAVIIISGRADHLVLTEPVETPQVAS